MKKGMFALCLIISLLATLAVAEAESCTTGLPTTKAYKPIVCQMDNEPGARPQCGIASADVIYEAELYDGGYTRYTCVFNDEIPEKLEAIRSARIFHIDLYKEWGGIFTCFGFQYDDGTNASIYAEENVQVLLNGNAGLSGFYRDKDRKAPNNVVFELAERYNAIEEEFPERSPFVFSDTPTEGDEIVHEFEICYRKSYDASFVWDDDAKVYLRYYNGKPQMDGYTSEQLSFSNVIVQNAEYTWYDGNGDRPVVALTGANTCEYFINGKHFSGYWVRNKVDENTTYYDDNGSLVKFARGKTFVQIVDSVEVSY